MGTRKRWGVLGLSLALAGGLLALTGAMLAAAGGLWASLGTDGGGVVQLAAADTNPATLYARTGDVLQFLVPMGYPASGIWKSSDGGDSWHPTALGVDAASGDSNVILAAMGVSADGSTVCAGDSMQPMFGPPVTHTRVWCSTNGGNSWHSSKIPTSMVRALVVLNGAGGRVVAGSAMGNERPLFYSDDDGTSWHLATVMSTSNQIDIFALAEGSAYAGGDVYVSGSWRPVVFTSTDGITWQQAFTDTSLSGQFVQIVADPTDTQRAYAVVGAPGRGNVYSTTNKGQSWAALTNQPGANILLTPVTTWLAVDSQGRVYASTISALFLPGIPRTGKVYRSDDHGSSWGLVGQTSDQKGIDSVVVDPNDDDMLYVASGESDYPVGVYRTPSGSGVSAAGYSFQPSNSGLRAYSIFDVASNRANPSVIYAAGWGQGVIKSADGGASWTRTSEGLASTASAVAVHPSNPNVAYFGLVSFPFPAVPNIYRSTDGGNVWKPAGAGIPGGTAVTDLAINPTSPATVYAASWPGGLAKSTDSGGSWNPTSVFTPAYAVAIHPTTPNTLYVGVNNAVVVPGVAALYKSTDGGASVKQMAVGQDCMSDVLVNPTVPNEVFALSCYGMFLKSTTDGTSWTSKSLTQVLGTGNFPYNMLGLGVPRLAYDSQGGILYASLGAYGLLASHDGGGAWAKVTDAPDMAMYAPFYQPGNNALYVGGSNGLWRRPSSTYLPAIKKDAS